MSSCSDDEDCLDEVTVPAALQRKIAVQARLQQDEITGAQQKDHKNARVPIKAISHEVADNEEEAGSDDGTAGGLAHGSEYSDDDLRDEDHRALGALMDGASTPTRTLADIIMDKINERKAAMATQDAGVTEGVDLPCGLPPKVMEVYVSVGKVLSSYKSGKLPKAFKIVPRLVNWEEVLYAMDPDGWTPAATSEATRLFASNLNHKMAQRFFNLVLLPAVQRDIKRHGKLNFHLYLALKRALYKPSAFFKGLLLPLCEERCTVREALIVASVLQKVSVPMLHAAVAILKLAEMSYTPANMLFLRTLLLKKYAIPFRVVDALVDYFAGFINTKDVPPVLWQQTLLTFVQYYKAQITAEQKGCLKDLLRAQPHSQITPEIRRELLSVHARGESQDTVLRSQAESAEPMMS